MPTKKEWRKIMSENFWRLTVDEVQELASQEIGRELTESELKDVENGFIEGTAWHEVLTLAIQNCKDTEEAV
jgi:hypothetical protein